MKKFSFLISLLLLLSGCGEKKDSTSNEEKVDKVEEVVEESIDGKKVYEDSDMKFLYDDTLVLLEKDTYETLLEVSENLDGNVLDEASLKLFTEYYQFSLMDLASGSNINSLLMDTEEEVYSFRLIFEMLDSGSAVNDLIKDSMEISMGSPLENFEVTKEIINERESIVFQYGFTDFGSELMGHQIVFLLEDKACMFTLVIMDKDEEHVAKMTEYFLEVVNSVEFVE